MSRSRLLLFALILVLVLPPGLVVTHAAVVPQKTSSPGLAVPQETGPGRAAPALDARKRGEHKAKRRDARQKERRERKERRQDRRDRQRSGLTPAQAQIEALVDAAPPRIPALAVTSDPCGPELIQLRKSGRCTHGPDPEPPPAARAAARELRVETPAALCDGDGVSGFRVQVLYLRSTGSQDRYATSLSTIRQEAEGANVILRNSQPGVSDKLNYHFVRNASCDIDVVRVEISRSALLDFDGTIAALEQQGFDATDRIYLMFADTSSAGICGIGTVWPDDKKSSTNFNNRGPSYARADLGCWDAHTAAHELMHNLGAVQDSAPHSTGFGHCIDEYDVMCYPDAPQAPPMQVVCANYDVFEFRYDCNNDDYFAAQPAPGNYLASHWNTADNWFLTQDVPAGTDLTPPDVEWVAPVGNGQTYTASSGEISLQASATDASGVDHLEFWLYDAISDGWIFLGEDLTAPYTSSINVSALRSGLNYLTADAYDIQGNWVDEEIWIQRSAGATVPTITLTASASQVKAKRGVTLTAAVVNAPASGTQVEFRVCRGSGCTWEAGQSLGVFPGTAPSTTWKASGKGSVTFLAQVTGDGGTATSNPAVVSVKKVKKKH
ncbi:MAG: Ig-like domain-containing protein [Thermomicrobiales bacterium]